MKFAPRSFVARPLLLASLLVSTAVLAAVCPGSQEQAACQAKAIAASGQAYTYVYNYVIQACQPRGSSYCVSYAQREASKASELAYASQYSQCMSSGGQC